MSNKSASLPSNNSNGIFAIQQGFHGTLGLGFSNDEISEYKETAAITDPETSNQITITGLNLQDLSSASNISIGEGLEPMKIYQSLLPVIRPVNLASPLVKINPTPIKLKQKF